MASGIDIKMSNVPKVTLQNFDAIVEGYLNAVGLVGTDIMKKEYEEALDNGNYTGKTQKSFTFATKNAAALPEEGDVIEQPSSPYEVYIGSANPNAYWTEYGTPAHRTPDGSKEFVQAIKDWAEFRNIPEEYVGGIITNIRRRGTKGSPFVPAAMVRIAAYAKERSEALLKELKDDTITVVASTILKGGRK